MGSMIWMIIVVIIVVKICRKSSKKEGKKLPAQPVQRQAARTAQPVQRQTSQRQASTAQPVRTEYGNVPPTQTELKQRLQEKYKKNTTEHSAILDRAIQNNREEEAGNLAMAQKEEIMECSREEKQISVLPNDLCQYQERDVMDILSDIMAKGVDSSLTFERDFVSEGIDMINRMSI